MDEHMKICYACKMELSREHFAKDKTKLDGLNSACKSCKYKYKADWQKKNREKVQQYRQRHYAKTSPERKAAAQRRREELESAKMARPRTISLPTLKEIKCNDCLMVFHSRIFRRRCLPCSKELARQTRNRVNIISAKRNRAKTRVYERLKYQTDARYNLTKRFRLAVRGRVIGKRGRHVFDLLPYTADELETRLKSTLPQGYLWADFIAGRLHIDHIKPVAAFDFSTPDEPDFQACWSLSNLQLLPAVDNLRKGDRIVA
jgi:hypothetical protein